MPTTTTPPSPQEKTPPKPKKRRPTLRAIAITILLLISAAAIDIAYIATRPDIPPFDESALALDRPKVPDNENGAVLLEKAIGQMNPSRAEWFNYYDKNVKNKRSPTDAEISALKTKYGKNLELIKAAAYSEQFLSPLPQTPLQKVRQVSVLLSVSDYSKVNSTLAWGDLRRGGAGAAAQKLQTNITLANALILSKGDLLCFLIGSTIGSATEDEINAMMDGNLLSQELLADIFNLLGNQNQIFIEARKNNAKTEYASYKKLLETDVEGPNNKTKTAGKDKSNAFYLKATYRKYKTHKIYFDFYKSIVDNAGKPYADMKIFDTDIYAPYRSPFGEIKLLQTANWSGVILASISLSNSKSTEIDNPLIKQTENELLKTKAAIALYRMKHGKFPETLNALTPEFLPSTPIDPFDGKPVRYNKSKNLIYSVGYNLKDDGGSAKRPLLSGKKNRMKIKDEQDIILPLSPPNKTQP